MITRVVELVEDYLEKKGSRDALGYLIEWLCKRTKVYGYLFRGL